MRTPTCSTLFPYTTLFRSDREEIASDYDLPRLYAATTSMRRRELFGCPLPPRPSELVAAYRRGRSRSEEHTSELQSLRHLVCRLLLEKKKKKKRHEALSTT